MGKTISASLLAASLMGAAQAADLAGTKHILAHTGDGKAIAIGTVVFTPGEGGKTSYRLDMDTSPFKEFFLSMRQFKCLEGPDIQCYVPYPYDNPHEVTAKDLGWLESDLLFFWKAPNDYGAKLGNGLIYKLSQSNGGLVGKPQAISLDKIASPPDNLKMPPYAPEDRDDVSEGSRWIVSLTIE